MQGWGGGKGTCRIGLSDSGAAFATVCPSSRHCDPLISDLLDLLTEHGSPAVKLIDPLEEVALDVWVTHARQHVDWLFGERSKTSIVASLQSFHQRAHCWKEVYTSCSWLQEYGQVYMGHVDHEDDQSQALKVLKG